MSCSYARWIPTLLLAAMATPVVLIHLALSAPCCASRTNGTTLAMARASERLEIYTLRHRAPPSTADGLAILYEQAPPTDAWDRPLHYHAPGPDGRPFELVSYGPDGLQGGGDDILWGDIR